MGMLQKSVFNLLSQESEKLIKDLYLKYRHKLRDEYRDRCQAGQNYEITKRYVEEKIEKDILYFDPTNKVIELQNIKDQIKKNLKKIKKRRQDCQNVGIYGHVRVTEPAVDLESLKRELEQDSDSQDYIVKSQSQAKDSHNRSKSLKSIK